MLEALQIKGFEYSMTDRLCQEAGLKAISDLLESAFFCDDFTCAECDPDNLHYLREMATGARFRLLFFVILTLLFDTSFAAQIINGRKGVTRLVD